MIKLVVLAVAGVLFVLASPGRSAGQSGPYHIPTPTPTPVKTVIPTPTPKPKPKPKRPRGKVFIPRRTRHHHYHVRIQCRPRCRVTIVVSLDRKQARRLDLPTLKFAKKVKVRRRRVVRFKFSPVFAREHGVEVVRVRVQVKGRLPNGKRFRAKGLIRVRV